jgi:hypothetical protein
MSESNEAQQFHLYLWYNKTNDAQKEKIRDYYVGLITSDETDRISTMTYHELYRTVKYDGFERPIEDFDFEELLEQYIERGLDDPNLIKHMASIFSSIEYIKLYEEYRGWRAGYILPPLPKIERQVEVLLPNFCTLVISRTTQTDYYTVFIGHGFNTEPTTIREVQRRFRVFLNALDEYGTSSELTLPQLETIYRALSNT